MKRIHRSRDLMHSKKKTYSAMDFIPTDADLQVAIINRMVVIDMLVNTVKFLKYEHRDPTRMNLFDYSNPQYWYYYVLILSSSDWNHFVTTCYEQLTSNEEVSEEY